MRLRDGRTIAGIQADVCAACGERYYDLNAMQAIEDAPYKDDGPARRS